MTGDTYQVLILDDDTNQGELLSEFLKTASRSSVTCTQTEEEFWLALQQGSYDIIFLDYRLRHSTGLDVLAQMNRAGWNIPTVIVTGEGSEEIAVQAIQSGAIDYLIKGKYSFDALPTLLQKAVHYSNLQKQMKQYFEQSNFQTTLLNNIRDAVVAWDLSGQITYWNHTAEQFFNQPAAAMLGKPVSEVYADLFSPAIDLSSLPENQPVEAERSLHQPERGTLWINSKITPLQDAKQHVLGFMDVTRDVTPQKKEQNALLRSQRFIQRIVDTSPNVIFIYNLRSKRFRYVSPEATTFTGYSVEDIYKLSPSGLVSILHPDDLPMIKEDHKRIGQLLDGEVIEREFRLRQSNMDYRWMNVRESVFSRSRGEPTELIGVLQDVTRRKQSETTVQQRLKTEKLLSTISSYFINLTPDDTDEGIQEAIELVNRFIDSCYGSVYLSVDGIFASYVQPVFQIGQERVELKEELSKIETAWLKQKFDDEELLVFNTRGDKGYKDLFLPPGVSSAAVLPIVHNYDLLGFLALGSSNVDTRWVDENRGMLQTFAETIANALMHKFHVEELQKSEARYRTMVEEHQTEMICRFSLESGITYANTAYCHFYGQPRDQVEGISFLDPVHPDDQDYVRQTIASIRFDDPVKIITCRVQLGSEQERWLEWAVRAIYLSPDQFSEFQAVGRDVTDRKRMEEEIKRVHNHLAEARRLSSIGELASSVAHQISNPLTTIIADAQILSHSLGGSHPAAESAQAIMEAGWRAQKVINELMKFSEPGDRRAEEVDINQSIQGALLLTSDHLARAGIELEINLQAGLPGVEGNERQLTDLWVNLLLMARSASKVKTDQRKIRVQSQVAESGTVLVEVKDNGQPFSPSEYATAFEPKVLPTGSLRGTGIELSLCREIVRQHNGTITIAGDDNMTTFSIELPRGSYYGTN